MKKKLGLYFAGIYIFHIKGDDGEEYDVDAYTLAPVGMGKFHLSSHKVPHSSWENVAPYSNAIELDRDSMQGLILGVFGEEV